MSEKEGRGWIVMGRKCVNCGDWINAPQSLGVGQAAYKPCECGKPQTAEQKLLEGMPVRRI